MNRGVNDTYLTEPESNDNIEGLDLSELILIGGNVSQSDVAKYLEIGYVHDKALIFLPNAINYDIYEFRGDDNDLIKVGKELFTDKGQDGHSLLFCKNALGANSGKFDPGHLHSYPKAMQESILKDDKMIKNLLIIYPNRAEKSIGKKRFDIRTLNIDVTEESVTIYCGKSALIKALNSMSSNG